MSAPNTAETFWARVTGRENPEGCWLWAGTLKGNGYGVTRWEGRSQGVHRVAYKILVGPIEAESLDHLCRNTLCVNPKHLEPASLAENTLRGDGPTAVNLRKTHCVRGHEFTSENTIVNASGRHCRACAQTAYIGRHKRHRATWTPEQHEAKKEAMRQRRRRLAGRA